MATYLMALDQGTTSSRCIIFDKQGRTVQLAQMELTQHYPQPGWVEHNPMEIWSSQLAVATEAAARGNIGAEEIAAIGVTNQRETTIVWDKATGEPVYNAIVWQCRRTAPYIDALKAEGFDDVILKKTGLIADAYFSASKIRWILHNVPGALERANRGELLFGTVDSWLVWRMTRGAVHITDYSNASRTMLFNIHTLQWDDDILKKFGIPKSMLPKVVPSSAVYGNAAADFLGAEIPIGGIAGDQQAALFGQCCFEPGMVKNTYGTGCFMLMNTGGRAVASQNGLLTTIAWKVGGQVEYALEGSVFIAGAAMQWLRDGLRMIDSAPESEALATRVKDSGGIYVVPAFAGLGAPHWDPYARGTVVGLTQGVQKEHFVRATLESIAYQSHDVVKAMEADTDGLALKELRVDGGASANNFLMQFQADILGVDVVRPRCIESTALGAAYLAGLAVGFYKDKDDIRQNAATEKTFTPHMPLDEQKHLVHGWQRAVRCALGWQQQA